MTIESFEVAPGKLLERYDVRAESRWIDVPAVGGRAHVLVAGEGRPVVLVPGFGDPAAIWAPLMGQLGREPAQFRLHAVDRPAFGLSDYAPMRTHSLRTLAKGVPGMMAQPVSGARGSGTRRPRRLEGAGEQNQ